MLLDDDGYVKIADYGFAKFVKDDEICLESTRYPFCFVHGNDYSSGHEDSILPFLPFNQDLNRYILVVNNLKTPKAKVVWGSESREFSAADLKKGINLAAEFLKNPFVPSFTAVNEAVVRKCKYNQMVNMTYLGENSQNWRKQFPDQSAAFDAIEANFRIVNNAMLEKCAQLVKPVVHAIKIEPIP